MRTDKWHKRSTTATKRALATAARSAGQGAVAAFLLAPWIHRTRDLQGLCSRGLTGATMLISILAGGSSSTVAQEGSFAGIVSDITCRGQIIEAAARAPSDLNAVRDKRRPVAAGDRLRCVDAGQIVVQQGVTAIVIDKKDGWILIRPSLVLNAIVKSYDAAGTRQGGDLPIYSPPPDGTARAENLIIRWNPWPGVRQVTISVTSEKSRRKLCCNGSFEGTNGELDLPELRRALADFRDREFDDRKLVLRLTGSVLRDFFVTFSVLSVPEEAQLGHELSAWEDKTALVSHLGRAHVYSNYRLFTEAAKETEAALALAPQSPYLLAQLIDAENLSGNSAYAAELQERLTSLNSHSD